MLISLDDSNDNQKSEVNTLNFSIVQTNQFKKSVKKLHKNQKLDLDRAVKAIAENPELGEQKVGDLSDVWVYKFKMVKQLTLLAYQVDGDELILTLLMIGSHENFYRDLKNTI